MTSSSRAPRPGVSAPASVPVPRPRTRLGARVWAALLVVGLTGQVAWAVENMYLNVYLYQTVTSDPTATATMVAASAVTATLAAALLGTASDRWGRRRELIAIGYLLWGLSTAAFGVVGVDALARLVGPVSAVGATVAAIVVLDCVMSFLGAGANDAAFSAWVTDVTDPTNRGRVDATLAVLPLVAMLVVFGALDGLTRSGRWSLFFGIVGAATSIVGAVSWFLVREAPSHALRGADTEKKRREGPDGTGGYLRSLVALLRPAEVRANPGLYWALLVWCVLGTAVQVFLPYLIIYIQYYLRIDDYAVVLGIVLTVASALSVAGGRVIDRVGKLRAQVPAVVLFAAGPGLTFLARSTVMVVLAGILMIAAMMLSTATTSAIVRDHTPADRAGTLQGLRMVAATLVPMVVGPYIGAAVIVGSQATYVELGQVRQVPTPSIFLVAALIAALALIPIALLRRSDARMMETREADIP
ncbi:MAG: MFS transporter [Actinomyces sp.]|nr:MFS transporter [Actinomyces sp.]MCI1642926.1 MFS transporter [Actinomyces sp.]MCI1663342.1 MFS transporter [Actinomyces sp.]MCI1692213.1 MFS transporter [Actinomyces sp.]